MFTSSMPLESENVEVWVYGATEIILTSFLLFPIFDGIMLYWELPLPACNEKPWARKTSAVTIDWITPTPYL